MRALLDTHTFYWMVSHPENLGAAARVAIEEPSNELLLSAASLWEIATKHRSGKFPSGGLLLDNLDVLTDRLKIQTLSVSPKHAIIAGSMDWGHKDPFDRMLAAQCITEDMVLISKDSAFESLESVKLLWS
jgi:PIN domain nuclease of toxin-antitoxin system